MGNIHPWNFISVAIGCTILFTLCYLDLSRRYRRINNAMFFSILFLSFYSVNVLFYILTTAFLFAPNLWTGQVLSQQERVSVILASFFYLGIVSTPYFNLLLPKAKNFTSPYDSLLEFFSKWAADQLEDVVLAYQNRIMDKAIEDLYAHARNMRSNASQLEKWDSLDSVWISSGIEELHEEYEEIAAIEGDLLSLDKEQALKDCQADKRRLEEELGFKLRGYISRFLKANYSDRDRKVIDDFLGLVGDEAINKGEPLKRTNIVIFGISSAMALRIASFSISGLIFGGLIGIVIGIIRGSTNSTNTILGAAFGFSVTLFLLSFLKSIYKKWEFACFLGALAGTMGTSVYFSVAMIVPGDPVTFKGVSSIILGTIFGTILGLSYVISAASSGPPKARLVRVSASLILSGLAGITAVQATHGFAADIDQRVSMGLFIIGSLAWVSLYLTDRSNAQSQTDMRPKPAD